jgi:8-oxo-dGTP pyrophosphatase MutT (NUDIX family)
VAVLLQPIWERKGLFRRRTGLTIATRAILPHIGKPALIGGHVDDTDESLEAGAFREFKEETGLDPKAPPRLWFSRSTQRGQMLSFCTVDKPMHIDEWLTGIPCDETEALDVLWKDEWKTRLNEIAFPLHREAITRWFLGID